MADAIELVQAEYGLGPLGQFLDDADDAFQPIAVDDYGFGGGAPSASGVTPST